MYQNSRSYYYSPQIFKFQLLFLVIICSFISPSLAYTPCNISITNYSTTNSHSYAITNLMLSKNGSILVSVSSDTNMKVWGINDGSVSSLVNLIFEDSIQSNCSRYQGLDISDDQTKIVYGGITKQIRFFEWDAINYKYYSSQNTTTLTSISGLFFKNNNEIWAGSCDEGFINFYYNHDGSSNYLYKNDTNSVNNLYNITVVAASSDKSFVLVNNYTSLYLAVYNPNIFTYEIKNLISTMFLKCLISNDSTRIVLIDTYNNISIIEVTDVQNITNNLFTQIQHIWTSSYLTDIFLSADNRRLIATYQNGSTILYQNTTNYFNFSQQFSHWSIPQAVTAKSDSSQIYIGLKSGYIYQVKCCPNVNQDYQLNCNCRSDYTQYPGYSNECFYCSAGLYLNITTNTCQSCNGSNTYCANCTSQYHCIACISNQYFLNISNFCNLCSSSIYGCNNCISQYQCTQCISNYYVSSGYCYSCEKSLKNCANCSSGDWCLDCNSTNYYVNNGSCSLCSSVLSNCNNCKNSNECTNCSSGYSLSNGTCVADNSIISTIVNGISGLSLTSIIVIMTFSILGCMIIGCIFFYKMQQRDKKQKKQERNDIEAPQLSDSSINV